MKLSWKKKQNSNLGGIHSLILKSWIGKVLFQILMIRNIRLSLRPVCGDKVNEVTAFSTLKDGYDKLPDDALAAIQKVVDEIK